MMPSKGMMMGGFKGKGYGRGFGQPQFTGIKRQIIGGQINRVVKQKIDPELKKKLEATEEWKLFMGQIPYQATEVQLKDLLKKYGEVLSLHVLTNEMGRSKGCGFLHFAKKEAAEKAMEELNGKELPIKGLESRNGKGIVLHLARDAKKKTETAPSAVKAVAAETAPTEEAKEGEEATPAAAEETTDAAEEATAEDATDAAAEEAVVEDTNMEEDAPEAKEATPVKAAAPAEDAEDVAADVDEVAPKTPFKWTSLKLAELKSACAARGLLDSGRKADLAKRLVKADEYNENGEAE